MLRFGPFKQLCACLRGMLRISAWLVALMLCLVALYFATAFALLLWPANRQAPGVAPISTQAFVSSNGIHSDLIFPLQQTEMDWRQLFPPQDLPRPLADARYIAIGWGERNFYLHVQQWRDLSPAIALDALLGQGKTLLHVRYLSAHELASEPALYRLPLSAAQYRTLIDHVQRTAGAQPAHAIGGYHYGTQDAFYEAQGHYNLFHTCNSWVGLGLRTAGVKTAYWTPLPATVTYYLAAPDAASTQAPR